MLNPTRYQILAIGKVRKSWIKNALDIYLKRLPGLTIIEMRDSNPTKEGVEIQKQLKDNQLLIALSEEGKQFGSIPFAQYLQAFGSQRLAFAIGGVDGLSSQIKRSAYSCISLSTMTFPHDIARLLLTEQIYRATNIIQGGSYHKG